MNSFTLWTLSSRYLDQEGLHNLWLNTILAKNALSAYFNHDSHPYKGDPQLECFKKNFVGCIPPNNL